MTDQFAEQQRRLKEALDSPSLKAAMTQAAEHQDRLRKALESPGFKAMD